MRSKLQFILAMAIFGSIGIFVRHIDLPSSEIAMFRGMIGSLFLLGAVVVTRRRLRWETLKANFTVLLASSVALGGNWIFLFQAFKHTSISNAVLSYYFAPVFLILLSGLVLKEKIRLKKVLCIACATLGMFFIAQASRGHADPRQHLLGVGFGLLAAALYATLMVSNKFIRNMTGLETTIVQLAMASLVLLPYVVLVDGYRGFQPLAATGWFLLALGVLHTGIGFLLFFSGMQGLKGQVMAALSYVDPVTAVLLSALLFGERMSLGQLAGAALILGSTCLSELGEPAPSPISCPRSA